MRSVINLSQKTLFLVLSVFCIFQSYILIKILSEQLTFLGPTKQLWMAFLLSMCTTGIFAFSGFAISTFKIFPENFYKLLDDLTVLKLYRIFCVDRFRCFLLHTLWKNKKKRKSFFSGKKSGLMLFSNHSKQSEFSHFCALVGLLIVSVFFLLKGEITFVVLLMLINLALNFYPIVLQRFHRLRIAKLKRLA